MAIKTRVQKVLKKLKKVKKFMSYKFNLLSFLILFSFFSNSCSCNSNHLDSSQNMNFCTFSKETTLVLIDRTFSYDEKDKELLIDGIQKWFNNFLKVGDRVIIHTIAGSRSDSVKIFDGCRPGCSKSSWFSTCNSGRIKRILLPKFNSLFKKAIKSLLSKAEEHPRSAIIETLGRTTSQYNSDNLTKVIIYSDLLENSDFLNWKDLHEDVIDKKIKQIIKHPSLIPKIKGISVNIFGVGRDDSRERNSLYFKKREIIINFWSKFFKAFGSGSVKIHENLLYTIN